MKYAVEARIFNNGKIMAKLREALPGEEANCTETRTCDIWIDVFDNYKDAKEFLSDYKKA
ncbi:hypothetical protein [Anaerostipes caccae]|uniref:hypothetical protein n=1 Tax=Anaerostipes caccae TaxID=105841 RepID=UPI00267198C6|nr:hypothetical protein [Anaerostipes caccae]